MTQELKNCPFCGGEADDRHGTPIECRNCKNMCVSTSTPDRDVAIKAWNTRAEPSVNEEMLDALKIMVEIFEAYQVIGAISKGLKIDLARKAIANAEAQGDGWRTMDSAPRDGASIIIFDSHSLDKSVDGYGTVTARFDSILGWVLHQRYGFIAKLVNPTHWRPLPAPPSE